jgi:hypothetical protein
MKSEKINSQVIIQFVTVLMDDGKSIIYSTRHSKYMRAATHSTSTGFGAFFCTNAT